MCDMLVALPGATTHGQTIFAKNSDRNIGEPQPTVWVPAADYDLAVQPTVRCTYIEIPQVAHTYACVLCKPSWMWGAEMAVNERGLSVGNTAIFTKEPFGPESLIGMDYVRLCAERCETADQALELIIQLMDRYGQGGNCGYRIERTYHNCYLMADRENAWIMETAGDYWVAKRVRSVGNISNRISIGRDFDRCHPGIVAHAIERGLCASAEDFDFRACFEIPDGPQEANGSIHRLGEIARQLQARKGEIDEAFVLSLMRMHEGETDTGARLFDHKSTTVCMHADHDGGAETAGSMLVSYGPKRVTTWISGMSLPCLSVYKPLWFGGEMPIFAAGEEERAVDYWMKREALVRGIIAHRIDLASYERERARTERQIFEMAAMVEETAASQEALARLSASCFELEADFVERVLESMAESPDCMGGDAAHRAFWEEQNRILPLPRFYEGMPEGAPRH